MNRRRGVIDSAIRLHDKLRLILSEHSLQSSWVEGEVDDAFEKEQTSKEDGKPETMLFPIRLDDSVMDTREAWASALRRSRHIGDFSLWQDEAEYRRAFERLLRDLKAG